MTAIHQYQCPLCSGPNDCGNLNNNETSCWCRTEVFPDGLLQKVPQALKQGCVCQRCVLEYNKVTQDHSK